MLNAPVTVGALVIVVALLVFGGGWPDTADRVFVHVQSWILDTFGWFYILSVAIFVIVAFVLAFSKFGSIKLGPDEATSDYPYVTWLAMLFAAGMGIGIMYYAVAQPMQTFLTPPTAEPRSIDAQREAMVTTIFDWGIHAWAVYGIVGLSLAYFGYRYNLPLTIRSGLYPLLRNRIEGPIGHAVDIFAIVSTLFGIATSLGLGVLQINAGLAYLFGISESRAIQIPIIIIVTAMASVSVVLGLDVGIRRLSELNLVLALLLMVFVLFVAGASDLLGKFVQNIGLYLGDFVPNSFNLYAYEPTEWLNNWTLFFWAWWIAWSPFVGMFIAQISRGRTVREFVLGVLLVPSTFTALWMTVFGNTAITVDLGKAQGELGAAVEDNISVALFKFFEYFPGTTITSGLAVILIAVFFVTSSDSGSLVVDTLASGGAGETPAYQKLVWTSLAGIIAAILLLAGGLNALQTATIAAALPFALIILILCLGLFKGMAADLSGRETVEAYHQAPGMVGAGPATWRRRLALVLRPPRKETVERYVAGTVIPAWETAVRELARNGVEARIEERDGQGNALVVATEGARDFVYGVHVVGQQSPGVVLRAVDAGVRSRTWLAKTFFADGRKGYNIMGFSREQLIEDMLGQYEAYVQLIDSTAANLYITSPEEKTES